MKHKAAGMIVLIFLLTAGAAAHAQHLVFSTFEGYESITNSVMEVMTEAYGRIGITIEIKRYPAERAIRTANAGKSDGELFRKKEGIEQAFPNLVKVPICIHITDFVVFTKDTQFTVDGWKSLLPYSVGYKRGVKALEMNVVEGTRIDGVRTTAQIMRKLDAGRNDIAVEVRSEGLSTLNELGLKDIRILEPPLLIVESFHYLHVKNKHLVKPLTEVLQQMEREGVIDRINKRAGGSLE